MFYQIFLSSQVKRLAIITYKHGIYELPHDLLDNVVGCFTWKLQLVSNMLWTIVSNSFLNVYSTLF